MIDIYVIVEVNITTGNYRIHRVKGTGDIPVFPTVEEAQNHAKIFSMDGVAYLVFKMESVP